MENMDPDDFLFERRYEYNPHKDYFPDLFLDRPTALSEAPEAIVAKLSRTGRSIAQAWEALPEKLETSPIPQWAKASDAQISMRRMASIPNEMIRRGDTLTWPDLLREIQGHPYSTDKVTSRRWLQHLFLESYSTSFSLRVIRHLPAQLPELGYVGRDLAYDYDAIKAVFNLWGMFNSILDMTDLEIVLLRSGPGFVRFRQLFDRISSSCNSVAELKGIFALACNQRRGHHAINKFLTAKGRLSPETLDAFFNEVAGRIIPSTNTIKQELTKFSGRGHVSSPNPWTLIIGELNMNPTSFNAGRDIIGQNLVGGNMIGSAHAALQNMSSSRGVEQSTLEQLLRFMESAKGVSAEDGTDAVKAIEAVAKEGTPGAKRGLIE
ncbi:MAG: hypothetical protein DLM68_04150 [Hyphomicrobiales bacterium]|nr:MAG: hypothetical protein DLM68_04150 [Hyphomicrobiales bacterium]